jgi:acyl-CoA thioesterase FadM
VTYYSYFDTAANSLLIQKTGFDIHNSEIIGLVVDSACSFQQELSFQKSLKLVLRLAKLEIHHLDMNWRSLNKVSTKLLLKGILSMSL